MEPMRICKYGESVLRKRSEEITSITPEVCDLAERMMCTLENDELDGIGLAAPQIGENVRLVIINIENIVATPEVTPGEMMLSARMPLILVNPEVLAPTGADATESEGCLSVPGINGSVTRPEKIMFKTDLLVNGGTETVTIECGGLLARCIQHEIDHLDGVLFVDRLSKEEAAKLAPDLRALEKKTRRELRKR